MKYKNQIIKLIDINGKECEVKQVNYVTANNVYDNGKTIWLYPCNLSLNNARETASSFNQILLANKYDAAPSFDYIWYYYQLYYCNTKNGRYPIFFIEK